ncbi:hypothetical protein G4B88_029681 [Cannabis sativa]|uniref:DUF4283 domain-containing protein n=1 Tax=Cannabis sativa TaxID=3483 RepID=A0A7J6EXJ2_CANSA|nr:hypothetical protein G4B88_029681 [Cannabis sativa]
MDEKIYNCNNIMEVVIANKHSAKGKSLSCSEATVTLNPSASSLKVLTTFCLFGKVVAPMSVEVTTVQEFVDKTWHIPVSIVAIPGEAFNSNYFELGFNDEEVRTWALEKGPWCVRGYTLVLQAWSPREGGKLQFTHLKLCIQIHNLPHEYFSVDNGKFLGSLAGEVLQVDLDEDKPASWSNFLKVWVVIDIAEPLFSGCFFDLASGVKIWLQFKFERIGIFCYNYGCLGHQRRGCSLSSPVTVEKGNGIPFPLFGPWLSISSSYLDVFSGANTFVPSRGFSSTFPQHRLPGLASSASKGGNRVISRRIAPTVGGFSRMSKRVTRRSPASMGFPKSAAWVPRSKQGGGTAKISGNGNGVLGEQIENGKASENFPDISLRKTLHCFSNSVRNSNPPNVSEAVKETHHVMHVQKEVGSVLRGPFEDQQMGNGPFNYGLQVTINKSHGEGCSHRFIGPVGSGLQDTNNDIPTSVGPTIPINVLKRSVILKDGPENPNRGLIQMKGNINKLSGGSYLSNVGHDSLEALGPDGLSKESIEGQDVDSGLDEKKALASFFQAQETLLHELKHFGNLDLYEIKQLGGDIGVKPTSETNERVTPFKKRKFFESSASLCSRPHKIIRRHPGVIRDFPWDSEKIETADKNDVEDPSEDTSCSLSCPEESSVASGGVEIPSAGSTTLCRFLDTGSSSQSMGRSAGFLWQLAMASTFLSSQPLKWHSEYLTTLRVLVRSLGKISSNPLPILLGQHLQRFYFPHRPSFHWSLTEPGVVDNRKLTDELELSTNLQNNPCQGHEVEACQTEHPKSFLPAPTVQGQIKEKEGMGETHNTSIVASSALVKLQANNFFQVRMGK